MGHITHYTKQILLFSSERLNMGHITHYTKQILLFSSERSAITEDGSYYSLHQTNTPILVRKICYN